MACTELKFAHFTANQAILDAFNGAARVHVIDFSFKDGMQWPALMQALALRPGSPPAIILTGIGPPQPDNADALQQVGLKLAQLAETIGLEFEFRGLVTNSLADLDPELLNGPGQVDAVAVNSVHELHPLLGQPGAIEKVLNMIKALSPKIVTVVEQEGNNIFDSTRARLNSAGFRPVHLGSNAFKQASMMLALFDDGKGYRVEENDGCLMLACHTRLLITTSAWESA